MLNFNELDLLNKKLEEFFSKYDIELTFRVGEEFAYFYEKDVVNYSLTTLGKQDVYFKKFFHKLDNRIKDIDIFMLSLLHEVGHFCTLEDIIDDDLYEQEQRVKETLDGSKKTDNYIYFSLPSEMAATLWAIDFIIENSEELSVLWTELQNHIMQFYKDNGVEIDD